jgi:hypothetical protein
MRLLALRTLARAWFLAAVVAASTCALPTSVRAWSPPVASEGPLTISIAPIAEIEIFATPREVPVAVTFKNGQAQPLRCQLKIEVIDGWKVTRPAPLYFDVAGNASHTETVGVTPSPNAHAALYPIHARVLFNFHGLEVGMLENPERAVNAVLIVPTRRDPNSVPDAPWPILHAASRGATPLGVARFIRPSWIYYGSSLEENGSDSPGVLGTDALSGTSFALQPVARPDTRLALAVHPPWRTAAGEAYAGFRVALPKVKPLVLSFATAIRDSNVGEPLSDGVEFRVHADGDEIFTRFSTAKSWQPARVDLSRYAGRTIKLTLVTGPGPKLNTSVDQAYWAAPAIIAGATPAPESAASKQKRRGRALALARAARNGKAAPWSWTLRSLALAGTGGAAVVPGPAGLRDAFVAFAGAGKAEEVFAGFDLALDTPDGRRIIGSDAGDLTPERIASTWSATGGQMTHSLRVGGRLVPLRARLWAESGALRIAWSLPGVAPDRRGLPRIGRIAFGNASQPVRRAYAGFGNVLQNPGRWTLEDGGFRLSTRHVGADYANGFSLVQGSDIFPDAFEVDGRRGLASLATRHAATLSLIPSSRGAFAGARVWRKIANFKAAGGVAKLQGRMGLDQWGGDYAEAAAGLQKAADYGMRHSVFVKHVWQRWGYDYRLPDIYPPEGNQTDFLKMARAAKRNGILFCPHDNYIDFYPDAEGFSYRHILFNEDGTPQRAWLNEGRAAQSYRWNPLAFRPFLDRNLKAIKAGFGPTSYFVDVFTAIAPIDFYDHTGRFYPKSVTQREWGASFDRIRQVLGSNAPTISEAGTDALIGHLDGAQSDHGPWVKPGTPRPKGDNNVFLRWELEAADGERVPWHDMATHNKFVLFAGGLGWRYAAGMDARMHGYNSDDYLSLTALGGRSPMNDGPFSRGAVATYWLLQPLSTRLAPLEMTAHQFAGDDIHRQSITWSDPKTLAGAGNVHVNRGACDWKVSAASSTQVLPRYGFSARVGRGPNEIRADISRRDGVISAFSHDAKNKLLFADARPATTTEGGVRARVLGAESLSGGRIRVDFEWQVLAPVPTHFTPFVHFTRDGAPSEGIVFQGGMDFVNVNLSRAGTYRASATATLPGDSDGQSYAIRFGLYNPSGGARFPIASLSEGGRVKGGVVSVRAGAVSYAPEADAGASEYEARLNREAKVLSFGPLSTNGALRLAYAGSAWELMPLPSSGAFEVRLNLKQLGAGTKKIARATAQIEGGSTQVLAPSVGAVATLQIPSHTRRVRIELR